MPETLSPYALLCASKPKPPATVVTPYDLFSASQQTNADTYSHTSDALSAQTHEQSPPYKNFLPSEKTHYISDIHARHNKAAKHCRYRQLV